MIITHRPDASGHTGIWRTVISILCIIGLVALLAACASSHTAKLTQWEHPLVGKLWDVNQKKFIDQASLLEQIRKAEYLLLGERHDNLVHHQHQTWVIQQLQQSRRKASVAFEMIDDRQGNLLARHRVSSAEEMIAILDQVRNHWNYTHRYKDLFAQTLTAQFPIVPANLNRQRLMQVVKQGEDKLPAAYKNMLKQSPLSDAQMKSLQQEIKQSHCNMLDDAASHKLILAQRVRDAVIAHSLTKNRAPVKVLIAGAGHVRKDRGVPLYLERQIKGTKVLTIGFTEVSAGANDIRRYSERWSTNSMPFDIVWFTPTVERHDMCAQFKAMHKKHSNTTPP